MRKLLFNRESPCLQPLLCLIEQQKHRTLAIWAIDSANLYLDFFETHYPDEPRLRISLEKAAAWMRGEIKMPEAKKAIHAAHNAATEVEHNPACCAAARAVGHAAATVHVETHAIGLAMYGLTSLIYSAKNDSHDRIVEKECQRLYERLQYWQDNVDCEKRPWAEFLLNDDIPNKEKLLRAKNMFEGKST